MQALGPVEVDVNSAPADADPSSPAIVELGRKLQRSSGSSVVRWGGSNSYFVDDSIHTDVEALPVTLISGVAIAHLTLRGGTVGDAFVAVSEEPRLLPDRDTYVIYRTEPGFRSPRPILVRLVVDSAISFMDEKIPIATISQMISTEVGQ